MSYKVFNNHTLNEYNKKYGNKNLKKISKLDADKNRLLLENRSWWLIDNIYYEVPSNKGFKGWWDNLGKVGQIVTCCLGGIGVVTAVTVPTVIAINKNKTVIKTADVNGDGKDLVKQQPAFTKQNDGSYKGKLEVAEGKSKDDIKNITIKVGNKVLVKNTDYTISDSFEIIIKAGVISNDNDNITIEVTKVVFYTINVNAETGGSVKGGGSFKEGTSVTITATPDTNYLFDGWYENDQKITEAEASYKFVATKDRTLKAKFKYDSKAFETCDWSFIKDACDALEAANFTEDAKTAFCTKFTINGETPKSMDDFVGVERVVKVNNQDHKVRVIGIEHDKDENNKALALTFEFANLISDSDGYSLAYQWNDVSDESTANYDYINSTIRYALTGEGDNGGKKNDTILVAQKGQTKWSTTYNKTILSMMPTEFSEVLKPVKKSVGTTKDYIETDYTDKLFMLSAIECGYKGTYDKGCGTTYKYYEGHTKYADAIRVKRQVNSSDSYTDSSSIQSSEGQAYKSNSIYNNAGHNYYFPPNYDYGGIYWLRSPWSTDPNVVCVCQCNMLMSTVNCLFYAYSISPAFCI